MGSGASTLSESQAKVSGDAAFKSGDYPEAILWWTQEILQHAEDPLPGRQLAVLHSNRSAGHFRVGMFEKALKDGLEAIELDPAWYKGYYNASKAFVALGQNLQAVSMLSKAAMLAGNDGVVHDEFKALQVENAVQQRAHQGCTFSWGVVQTGALGTVSTRDCEMPTMIDSLRGKHAVDASCGAMHSVTVTGIGEVYTWGSNKYGQTGHGGDRQQYDLPTIVPSLLGTFVTAVSCGSGHTIITTREGLVYSWGMGNHGQLGHGDALNVLLPRQVMRLTGSSVRAVATGIAHSLFLLANGGVVGCGMNSFGALGIDTNGEPVLSPTNIVIDDGASHKIEIVHISAGGAHTAMVSRSGDIFTAGSNSCGQLGRESCMQNSTQFTIVDDFEAGHNIAFVSCGEEFTVAVSKQRQVFSCGLGIGGQLGNGVLENCYTFGRIKDLDNCGIDAVSCSQGAVFAITYDGGVYTWGTQLLFSDHSFDAPDNALSFSRPSLSGTFSKRKKARQICCGRKHYLLLTIAPYGPTSGILSSSWKGINDQSGVISISAGTTIRCTIQTRDVLERAVEFGGASIIGSAMRRSGDDGVLEGSRNGIVPYVPPAVFLDDNFDGTYSLSVKLVSTGTYDISVSLDELDIEDSPFRVDVTAGCPYANNCKIVSCVSTTVFPSTKINRCVLADVSFDSLTEPLSSDKLTENKSSEESVLSARVGDAVLFVLCIEDKFGNMVHTLLDDNKIIVHCCGQLGSESPFVEEYDVSSLPHDGAFQNNETSVCFFRICFEMPHVADDYELTVNMGNIRIGSRKVQVTSEDVSPAKSLAVAPSEGNVDHDVIVTVQLRDCSGNDISSSANKNALSALKSKVRPRQCDISSRALIHLGSTKEMSIEHAGVALWSEDGQNVLLNHVVKYAGLADITVWVGNTIILSKEIMIRPGKASCRFTEVMNPRVSLANWIPRLEPEREVLIQCRDSYGNKITAGGEDVTANLIVFLNSKVIESNKLKVMDANNGVYRINLSDRPRSGEYSFELAVTVDGVDLLYSPFALHDVTSLANEDIANDQKVLAPIPEPSISRKLDVTEKARLIDITRQRANERLKREQKRLRKEKNERAHMKAVKRTGGGFIIQYSKDI